MQEQMTSAIETVVNRVDIMEGKNDLRLKKLNETNDNQMKEIKDLRDALEVEKNLNLER